MALKYTEGATESYVIEIESSKVSKLHLSITHVRHGD